MTDAVATAALDKPKPPPWRRAVMLITVISLLNSMAGMMLNPVTPQLVVSFTHQISSAALVVGAFASVFALTQFFAAPVLGSLSDAYGRRTVILVSALGLSADYLFMALAPSLGWLFVGRMISGVTAASGPAVNAYIADSIPPEERAGAFGWTGAAFAIGFLVGPSLGGLLGGISLRLPFFVSAGLCLAVALYGLFVLPESLPKERRSPFSFRRANPVGSFLFLKARPQVASLVVVLLVMTVASQCLPFTLALYTKARFNWSVTLVGAYLTYAGIGHLFVQSLVVRRFVARFGERAAAITGYAGTALGFFIYATATTAFFFPIGMPFYAMAGLVGPAVQSQMTRIVAPTEQGQLQGAVAALQSVSMVIAPLVFTGLYSYAIGAGKSWAPQGLHMYVASAILASGAFIAWRNMQRREAVT